ncbi:MAG TPA: hypothetical protein VI873_01020 [Candidatus Peribacteraceae bacterium]|nr:hypothetical protein [Candidatus Peribacteraceae bacterium]
MMQRKTLVTASVIILLAAVGGVYIAKSKIQLSILQPAHATFMVKMTPGAFDPSEVSVFKNTNVCFENEDTEARWPASNIHPTHAIFPEFDPGTPIAPGKTWCFQFTKTGIWRMHDHLFPEITGVVNVRGK